MFWIMYALYEQTYDSAEIITTIIMKNIRTYVH